MTLKKLVCILFVIVNLCSIFAQKKMTIKIASVAPARSAWENEQKVLASEWNKATNGMISVQFYNMTALGGENGVVQKMRSVRPGQSSPIDGAIFTNLGAYELAPDSNVLTLCIPFLFRSQDEVDIVLEKMSGEINNAMQKQGFVLLGWFNVGWANFYTKTEVRTPDQLKNSKLSVGGITSPALGRAFQLAGYNTEDVPNEKIIQSMKAVNGIKGLYTIPMYAYAAQYYKHLPYVINTAICPIMATFVISEKTWEQISTEYKPALLAAVKNTESKFVGVQQETDKEYLDLMAKDGLNLVNLSPSELSVFENSLNSDALAMSKTTDVTAINYEFFLRINAILQDYRAGKQ